MSPEFLFQPYFCEENVWHLCQHPRLAERVRYAVWILASEGYCPLWAQRGALDADTPIFWDYHVVAFARSADGSGWECWDLNTTNPFPCRLGDYLRLTFPYAGRLPARFEPWFRLVPAAAYVREFTSDRRHMRDQRGRWQHPPPPWPAIHSDQPPTFERYRDLRDPIGGPVLGLEELVRTWT